MRSRNLLRGAFLSLIKIKSLEQVSLQDITDEAGVSYPTFFRHFASKEALLEDIAADQIRQLLSLTLPLFEADQQHESLQLLCGYVDENRSLWKNLLNGGARDALRREFIRIAAEIGSTMERTGIRANPWLPTDLASSFVVNGIFEILAWWLRQPGTYPVENIMTFLDVLIVRSTARPVDVNII